MRKYKAYKEKYLLAVKNIKQTEVTINAQKKKISGYDRLVVKMQGELEKLMKSTQI